MTDAYHSPSAQQHRQDGANAIRCAVVTASDTRTLADDRGGNLIIELLEAAGHAVADRQLVPDDPNQIANLVCEFAANDGVEVVLITGGTGIAPRDQTPEAVGPLLDKHLPGFGELFRMLSYEEIGAAAMLSRAFAGVKNGTIVALLPGSPAAVRLAMDKLLIPELGHLVRQAK